MSFRERSLLVQKKNTALEEIREDHPMAEQETLKRVNHEFLQKKFRRGSADQGDPMYTNTNPQTS